MIGHEVRGVTSSVQDFAINESDCGKASMIGREGKEIIGSVQCYVVN